MTIVYIGFDRYNELSLRNNIKCILLNNTSNRIRTYYSVTNMLCHFIRPVLLININSMLKVFTIYHNVDKTYTIDIRQLM